MPLTKFLPTVMSVTIAGVAVLTACSSTESHPASRSAHDAALAASTSEQAPAAANPSPAHNLVLLKQATVANPADKQAWLKLAGHQFQYRVYGEAMASALKVLDLDPVDKEANRIVALAGLRLSLKALSERAFDTRLPAALRSEAQELSRQLRVRLGEEQVAVVRRRSDSGTPARSASSNAPGNAATHPGSSSSSGNNSAAKPALPKTKESDDPFAGLKD